MSNKRLIHITTKDCVIKIINEGFKPSLHGAMLPDGKQTIQWLGDGVYFFNDNDDIALQLGCNLVKNKFQPKIKDKDLKFICTDVDFGKILHLDITSIAGFERLNRFINGLILFYEETEKIEDAQFLKDSYKRLIKKLESKSNFENKPHGEFLGNMINEFMESYKNKFDIVSMSFFPKSEKHKILKTAIYGDLTRLPVEQHCVKNLNILHKEKLIVINNEIDMNL